MKEKTLDSKQIFECSFMTLHEDHVETVSGLITERIYIKHPGASCILPLLDDLSIILTKQYRYPLQKVSIEIPAGQREKEDTFLTCAMRELEEETGYKSDDYQFLYTIHPCVGYSNERLDLFIARNCTKVLNPKSQDEDEDVHTMIIAPNDVEKLLDSGEVTDSKTLVALNYYLRNIK